jgi:hypothetical protein
MTNRRRSKLDAKSAPSKPTPADAVPDVEGIPPHVWNLLQQAGDEAAQRLLELLQPVAFSKLAGSVQRSLLDLAFTRAYGLPVRRSLNVDLSSTDADAVAASLQALADTLPERRTTRAKDITPGQDTSDANGHSAATTAPDSPIRPS